MFSKPVKIKKRPDFLRIAKSGVKEVRSGLVLQALRRETPTESDPEPAIRIGYTASKKIGKAVVRNRAKRRLRALCAELLPVEGIHGFDYVVIARFKTAGAPYQKLFNELQDALRCIKNVAD